MAKKKDIGWFKKECATSLANFDLEFRFYDKSDFGSLHQVLFETFQVEVEICFWELGWLGIMVRNQGKNEQLFHTLLEPGQEAEKEDAFEQLRYFLRTSEHP